MKDKYLISVIGTQYVDGDKDVVKLKTVGEYYCENDIIT